ncbi:MAG: TIGR03618 family F420-dependent PPOX class oxidoreductase [Actinobacteria bacterium]|jgi:PPOX class probable F420-dependent enzyme|nr:TIGR03618 family F420-dependent PPOX class oxidoreductase [Ilumatobacteraceae bacterium]MDA0203159.1 TIGR03618 family F420-dependent PPOX class oxidoreductase [Actinomycetota bacterium]
MALDPAALDDAVLTFLSERHLASLTTLRADGSPHVVPVGFGYDAEARIVRIISFAGSQKVVNALRGGRAAVSQVDGGRWLTLEGTVTATDDAERVAAAVAAYAARYREPSERTDRVAIEIKVDRILGRG